MEGWVSEGVALGVSQGWSGEQCVGVGDVVRGHLCNECCKAGKNLDIRDKLWINLSGINNSNI